MARVEAVADDAAVAREHSRDRREYIPVGCGGAVPGADAPASALAQPPRHRLAAARARPPTARAARAELFAAWISNSAFESVGARDGAAAAYKDVLAAVSKALFESRDARVAGDRARSSHQAGLEQR